MRRTCVPFALYSPAGEVSGATDGNGLVEEVGDGEASVYRLIRTCLMRAALVNHDEGTIAMAITAIIAMSQLSVSASRFRIVSFNFAFSFRAHAQKYQAFLFKHFRFSPQRQRFLNLRKRVRRTSARKCHLNYYFGVMISGS